MLLIENIGELVTLAPLKAKGIFSTVEEKDLGVINKAWLLVENGKVKAFGDGPPPVSDQDCKKLDAKGRLLMPALVDSHTHLLFAGSRSDEFYRRVGGATYQEIAASGGGIRRSVLATAQASETELKSTLLERIKRLQCYGIGSFEVKTGYGLTVKEELRQLTLLNQMQQHFLGNMQTTCLALHAFPIDGTNPKDYIDAVTSELLPEVAEKGLASYVDAFIESGYYSVQQCESYIRRAKDLGLGVRLHADEFSDAGAALAAARWEAKSADHLQFASDAGVEAMAEAKVVATLLPATSLYTKIPFTNGKRFRMQGCAVAVATDFNPGSSLILNLPMLAGIACLHGGLTGPEAIAGVTAVAAHSLDLSSKGSLAIGMDADFFLHRAGNHQAWLADFGGTLVDELYIRGKPML